MENVVSGSLQVNNFEYIVKCYLQGYFTKQNRKISQHTFYNYFLDFLSQYIKNFQLQFSILKNVQNSERVVPFLYLELLRMVCTQKHWFTNKFLALSSTKLPGWEQTNNSLETLQVNAIQFLMFKKRDTEKCINFHMNIISLLIEKF